ncbi:MAG: DUF86 domain-containing protein [Ignavibacteriales bacterium]|nr:DUF86 domain-containing protein [Ignavibacteriales bacterium]
MSKREQNLLLQDMLESAIKIKNYIKGVDFEQFKNDDKTVDAVVRNFEIIIEASTRIDSGFKKKHSNIDWKRLKGFRNRVVHHYFGIDYQIVWSIIINDLDDLISQIKDLIN